MKDVPFAVDTDQSQETNKCMSHQSNTAALRGTVEESDLGAVLLKRICVEQGCSVRIRMNTLSIAGLICNHSCAIAVNTDLIAVNDFQARLVGLPEVPTLVSTNVCQVVSNSTTDPRAFLTTASASSSTNMYLGSFGVPVLCLPELGSSTRGTISNSSHRRVGN